MRCCRTVIFIALRGCVPVIAAVLVMSVVLPAGRSQAAEPVLQAAPVRAAPVPVVEEGTKQVLVLAAARSLPAGTVLAGEHLTGIGIAADLVGHGHIRVDNLDGDKTPYGYAVRGAIAAGTPLTWLSLVGPRQEGFLAAVLKPGMRAVTVTLGPATVGSGIVEPGDRVDVILASHSRESGEGSVLARRLLEDVRVVAVDRRIVVGAADASAPGDKIERGEIVTATLEVLPSQTGLLGLGELEGELSLVARPPAAGGERVQALDAINAQRPPVLAEEVVKQMSLQQTVRVMRGSAVDHVVFGNDLKSAAHPDSAVEQGGPEAVRKVEPLRPRTQGRPGLTTDRDEPIGGGAGLAVEAAPDTEEELASALTEGTPMKDERSAALAAGPQHALVAADPGSGGVQMRRMAGGTTPSVEADPAVATEDWPGLAAVALMEAGPIENGLDAGAELEHVPELEPVLPVLDVATEARSPRGAVQTGAAERAATAELALTAPAEHLPDESGQPAALSVGELRTPSAAEADPGSVFVQSLAGGIALPGAADSAAATEEPPEPEAAALAEAETVENGSSTAPELEFMTDLEPARSEFDAVPTEPAIAGTATADGAVPATTEAADWSSLSESAPDEHAPPLALGLERPNSIPASAPDAAAGSILLPARRAVPADAADSAVAAGLAADLLGKRTPAQHDLAAEPRREPSRTDRVDRPDHQGVAAKRSELVPAAAEQAVEAAVASLPWAMLSANGATIAGGGALLLGWTGAFLWLRRQNKALRSRLQSVSAPLTGHGAVEQIAPEESIFRPRRPDSRLSWLWRRLERRYPLIDAPQVFPRLLGVGVLAAALVWAGMWVMGMPGAVSPLAAAIGGFAGAWFFLGRVQARKETQFVQQFPEVVDQIVRLSGAGLPPLEALGKVAEDAQEPVKGVLEEVSDALLAGLDADTALGMVAGRVRLAEFTLFAAVIRLQRRAGGSISGAFSNLSNTLRARRATALKAKASTAQTRLTLLVLMLMPPLVLGAQSMTSPG